MPRAVDCRRGSRRCVPAAGVGPGFIPLTCIGSARPFGVVVPASVGMFELAPAQVTASVVIEHGRTERTQDSETLEVQPTVLVELGETAQLETGGGAVAIDVTVACPVGTTGLQSRVDVSQQGRVSGNGVYAPGLRRDAAHVQGPGRGVEWHISDGDRPGTDLR
jgi:hypothetical protein